MPPRAAEPSQAMAGVGASKEWEQAKANHQRIARSRRHRARWLEAPAVRPDRRRARPAQELQPVIDMGVSTERLESMINKLFSLHDASPPMLLGNGHLRPLYMRATLATMVMYYQQRFEAKEMHTVLTAMREAYSAVLSSVTDSAPGAHRLGRGHPV